LNDIQTSAFETDGNSAVSFKNFSTPSGNLRFLVREDSEAFPSEAVEYVAILLFVC
jgi:hypothetical protein